MFDPTLPADHTKATAAQMRGQLTGLKALIDALAAGTVTAAEVDGVNTIPPGNPAGVGVNVVGNTLHLTFAIPQGNDGQTGPQGNNGMNGSDGQTGQPGAQGEVNLSQLSDAITNALGDAAAAAAANSSAKSNGVATLDAPFANDPPTLADLEVMRAKMNEMLLAMRR